MEQFAKDAKHHPSDINTHLTRGIPQEETKIRSNSRTAYPRISQKLWLFTSKDGKPRQHYCLMQIPFNAKITIETGYAKTYQFPLHFEKTCQNYSSKEILEMAVAQF
jgi:hypothetical protein